MKDTVRTELTLPNDGSLLGIARTYVAELAGMTELPEAQADSLVAAVEEACVNVIRHAFEPEEEGTYTLAAELSPTALILSIRDRGLPFDPGATGTTEDGDPLPSLQGHGLERIRHAVDEATWINHGREGKELRLVKYRPHPDITSHLSAAELDRIPADVPLAPEQEYTIRRFHAADAVGVAQCIYRVYGYTYHHEDLYYPTRIRHLNETGERISVVAIGEQHDVVGHYALERPDLGSVAEAGEAVVSPAHRERRLMERMRELLEEEGRTAGLIGISGSAVTTHPYSQRSDERFGAHVCGISLALVPSSLRFKQITPEPLEQRVSCVSYFKYLVPAPAVTSHVPERHRGVLETIYNPMGVPVEYAAGARPSGPSKVVVTFRRGYGVGVIRVHQVGQTTAAEVERAREDLVEVSGADVVYLELPLSQPGTPEVCDAAEAGGFFLSGLGPHFLPDGDALRLQFLHTEVDLDSLQIFSPFAQDLLAYIRRERQGHR